MGRLLFETVLNETELPDQVIRDEFTQLLSRGGKNADELTIDDLRAIVEQYLNEVMLQVHDTPTDKAC